MQKKKKKEKMAKLSEITVKGPKCKNNWPYDPLMVAY